MKKTIKKTVCLLLAAALCLGLFGCGRVKDAPAPEASVSARPVEGKDFPDSYVDALPERAEDGLTLHAFNWTYNEVRDNLEGIRNAGFKNVLLMPVQQPKDGGAAWWAFYQPLSFSIGESSALGTKDELIALCDEAEALGICILADIVVNHMANIGEDVKEPDGTPTVYPGVQDYEPRIYLNRNEDTDGTGVTFHHNRGAKGTGADTQFYAYGNLPDLDTSNPYVQERILSLLKECIDAGIDGFRFDAAKHIETASDADYPSDFWENTLEQAKLYYREKTGNELYAYGEILNSPAGRSLSSYTRYMRITDDGFAAQFKNVFSAKDPSKILNADLKTADPSELIAWVESHDEYVSSNTHYSDVRVAKYWSVIAAKKDLGGLYLARPTEELTVGKIGSYAFESEYVAVSNRFHNRFYDADSYESVSGSCYVNEKIAPDDQGVLILNVGEFESDQSVLVSLPHLEDGNYYDALTGAKVTVFDHAAELFFDPSGIAILTRTRDTHPQFDLSERGCSYAGSKEITLTARNCDEAYYYFNGDRSETWPIDGTVSIRLEEHAVDGRTELGVMLRKGVNVTEQSFRYQQIPLVEGAFNILNLSDKYLNGEYELYIWSWPSNSWSRNYEIRDGVMLVDTAGMAGFLIAVFEKGYEIPNPNKWDSHVIKQSIDISGEILQSGFCDMAGF
ncbi:MAG: hypothetical protein IJQ43_03115 [Oscillospiraceae bacterium]|nr:hypothetical protein [Oscillospiraceae bacterium]